MESYSPALKGVVILFILSAALSGCGPPKPQGVSYRLTENGAQRYAVMLGGYCQPNIPYSIETRKDSDRNLNPRYALEVIRQETTHSACKYLGRDDVPKIQVDWTISVVDLESGEKLGEKTFTGSEPYAFGCPEMTTESTEAFYGCPDQGQFEAWLLDLLADRPGLPRGR